MLQRMDNEVSDILKNYMYANNIDFQLTLAGIHRCNRAKRSIQNFKNHLIASLCTVNPEFHLNLWNKLMPQAVLMINLLQPSRVNPRLLAYAQVHGHLIIVEPHQDHQI